MTNLCKSLALLPLQNALRNFQTIKIQTDIEDKPRRVKNFHYCNSRPKIRKNPLLVALSKRSSQLIQIDYESILNDSQSGEYLSGGKLIKSIQPISHNYSGHQFGVWANQLGDGRAHTLGTMSINGSLLELQIKGSGLSPFSRHADGNSVFSSAVREFFASQLMSALGVPTSRALSLVVADENVVRDPMYNGQLKTEKAAIVLRIAPTFIRFGSFEVCKGQCNFGDSIKNRQHLLPLANYILENFYPQIDEQQRDPYQQLFQKIVLQTAKLVAYWQSIGFVHGVLNTDNMSMVNITIDYGPFGFIDYFSKDYVSNATDQFERYSYRRQADVVKWNLQRLAEAFDYLVPQSILKKIIQTKFFEQYQKKYNQLFSKKLGLDNEKIPEKQLKVLVQELLNVMHICGSHFTNVFREIQVFQRQKNNNVDQFASKFAAYSCPKQYFAKLIRAFPSMKADLQRILKEDYGFNQYFIIEQKERIQRLQRLIHQDCKSRSQRETFLWKKWLQQYFKLLQKYRAKQVSKSIKYVLLNEIAVNITEQLKQIESINEKRAFMSKFLQVFQHPYEYNEWFQKKYWNILPAHIKLTCSS